MGANFVLICSDGFNVYDRKFDAWDIASHRLGSKYWPLYRNTRNRRVINAGDRFLIYIAGSGKHSRCIVGVGEFGAAGEADLFTEEEELGILTGNPDKVLTVPRSELFEPVAVQDVLPFLGAYRKMQNKRRWGALFVGGARRLGAGEINSVLEFIGKGDSIDGC